MTASFAAVIVIARHRREVSMMPATCASQVLVVACLPFVTPGSASGGDGAILAALGVGQMGVGLAFLTIGARLILRPRSPSSRSSRSSQGPLWVWLAYDERPSPATAAGGLVVAAVVVQAWAPTAGATGRDTPGPTGDRRRRRSPRHTCSYRSRGCQPKRLVATA